jgi:hypothetical protein
MKTNDLIRALAADHASRGLPLRIVLALSLALGVAVAFVQFMLLLGPRPGALQSLSSWRFCFKFVYALMLALPAIFVCSRVVSPLAWPGHRALRPLLFAPALLIAAISAELIAHPHATWASKAAGTSPLMCLIWVPLLSLPPFLALILALRRGAPASASFAGGIAGLIAGGAGASLYASHCTDDSPLFVALWYTLAILSVVLLGILCGRQWLRW